MNAKKKNIVKKSNKSLLESFKEKVQKQSEIYYKKLEQEKDEVKQFQIEREISKITIQVLLEEIKKMSNQDWIDFFSELFSTGFSLADRVFDQMDTFAFNNVDAPTEYKKYEKIKKHYFKTNIEYGELLNDADLDKKHLKRLLEFAFAVVGINTITNTQMILNWYEFLNAVGIVQRRLGFDHNWLMYMSLIQLHENLVKKKIVQLKGKIEKNEDMPSLISKLVSLIKIHENRDVSLNLQMSHGLKKARDTMTHSGYEHSILKKDVVKIHKEIMELEKILYGETT